MELSAFSCVLSYLFHCILFLYLAYKPATRTFQLALWGYSVASLPRASWLCAHKNYPKKKSVSQSTQNALKRVKMLKNLLPLWPIMRFALSVKFTKIFEKKSVSQSTQNALKRVKMQKKNYPFWPITRFARSAKFRKIFEKKSVSQSTRNALKRIEMQKKILHLWPITRFACTAKREWRGATLPTQCHPQGPKECPCQVSCRLD